ncbi:MAG TPA: YraN family protein [Acidimicrobiales bacterium]|nr:YraN family protein [Acidimicrobiales bacterium]
MSDRRNVARGRVAEDAAAAWYEARGFTVLARNWRGPDGEIDLICARGRSLLVVCEVKARRTESMGTPAEAVTTAKQRRIRRQATAFLRTTTVRYDVVRFDVACRLASSLHVIEGAF